MTTQPARAIPAEAVAGSAAMRYRFALANLQRADAARPASIMEAHYRENALALAMEGDRCVEGFRLQQETPRQTVTLTAPPPLSQPTGFAILTSLVALIALAVAASLY